ncbi:hypothetical protein [Bradyrhizobium sp. 30]|uniref:hypothetical protein n=1 Tax=Bradyrhizobium sp. 30 TaxID=2782669 RepID=UPI001FFAB152|nr:hypothetical protein [Bradyrhizobium sp. 30]
MLTFMFDDDAMKRSEVAVLEQLPRMIHAANRAGTGLVVEDLFEGNCNDTPVTSEIFARQLVLLRDEGELSIIAPDGSKKPRTSVVGWHDRLVLRTNDRCRNALNLDLNDASVRLGLASRRFARLAESRYRRHGIHHRRHEQWRFGPGH